MFTLKSRILVISSINKTADSSWQLLLLTRIRGCRSAAALCFHYFFLCLLDGVRFTLLEIEKGRRFCLSKPTKRRPNICDSFSAMMPLFSREKSSLKGRWRLETVQDMRSSSSNPVSCSETSIKIYGSKEEIRARKSPETVDAPGFAPDASIPVTLYVITQHYRFFEICF